jgi:hypothetical protein
MPDAVLTQIVDDISQLGISCVILFCLFVCLALALAELWRRGREVERKP